MKSVNNEKEHAIVKDLRAKGETVYSISRLNSFHNCEFEYYTTYVKRNRGISNPYSTIGSMLHEYIEEVYRGNITDTSDFNQKLYNSLLELEIMGLDFPSDVIKNSYTKDMDHFTRNFEKLDGEFIVEKMFVSKIGDNYLMGFLDNIQNLGDNNYALIDWKSSSKFSGNKLTHAGRQLVIYKLGLEQTTDMNITEIKWGMLKYINVCWVQANKKVKKKMVNRGKLIKEMTRTFEKEMLKLGMDELEVGMTLREATATNSMDNLPQEIKDKYWLEDCFVEYEATDEVVSEVEEYVTSTIEEIESKDTQDSSQWHPVDFDKQGTFYCNTLCSHRMNCSFIKEYNAKNPHKRNF